MSIPDCRPALLHSWAPEDACPTAADCRAPPRAATITCLLTTGMCSVDWLQTHYGTLLRFLCGYTSVSCVIWCSSSFGFTFVFQ